MNVNVNVTTAGQAIALSLSVMASAVSWADPCATRRQWVDGRGRKRERHGAVAERRAKNKAARAARKRGRR